MVNSALLQHPSQLLYLISQYMADLKEWISADFFETPQKLQQELILKTAEFDKLKLDCDAKEQQRLKDQTEIELLEHQLCHLQGSRKKRLQDILTAPIGLPSDDTTDTQLREHIKKQQAIIIAQRDRLHGWQDRLSVLSSPFPTDSPATVPQIRVSELEVQHPLISVHKQETAVQTLTNNSVSDVEVQTEVSPVHRSALLKSRQLQCWRS